MDAVNAWDGFRGRVRSWPAVVQPGRAYVVDDLPRIVISDYDYADALRRVIGVADAKGITGIYLVEWDIAMSNGDWGLMTAHARTWPDRVWVGPYLLYPVSTGRSYPFYAHDHAHGYMHTEPGVTCMSFGFGCVYLPIAALRAWFEHASDGARLTDTSFSIWYCAKYGPAGIVPGCRPVHLHY
jgi:hypothetical protein